MQKIYHQRTPRLWKTRLNTYARWTVENVPWLWSNSLARRPAPWTSAPGSAGSLIFSKTNKPWLNMNEWGHSVCLPCFCLCNKKIAVHSFYCTVEAHSCLSLSFLLSDICKIILKFIMIARQTTGLTSWHHYCFVKITPYRVRTFFQSTVRACQIVKIRKGG